MDFFDVKTLDEALKIVKNNTNYDKETISIATSVGRILAESLVSNVDLPDFNRSTVDGYAVFAREVAGASDAIPSMLTLTGTSVMGQGSVESLHLGEAIYVPTGGAIPKEADGVVMIETCEMMDQTTLLVKHPIHVGENITYKGDDVQKGQEVLERGRRLSIYDIGLLAGLGVPEVEVFRKLKVAVISTGDELITVHEPQGFGKIRDINGNALSAAITTYGAELTRHILVKDDFEAIKNAFDEALSVSDCVIFSGGSSVGAHDFTCDVITHAPDSELLIHGLAIKPGKPTIVARVGKKLVFGLPGHPSAALLVYNLLVVPYFDALSNTRMVPIKVSAVLDSRVQGAPGRDAFIMVSLAPHTGQSFEQGNYIAKPIHAKSGMITLLSNATGYIRISRDQEGLNEGSLVTVTLLRSEKYIGEACL